MHDVTRWALPAFFALYFLIAFVWRTWQVWRRTGINPYVLSDADDAYGYVGRGFRYVMLLVAAYLVVQAIWPGIHAWIGPLAWLERVWILSLGWTALAVSLLWLAVAQSHMGTSWRIGIDAGRHTALITTGVFALSRNPIFLGMRVNLLGLFLVRPSAATLAAWMVGDVLIQIQLRLEEAHLLTQHGERYRGYRARVRRWL